MCSGIYRPSRRHRSYRLHHLFLVNKRLVFLVILSAFIAVNSLLYRGIDRAEDRSVGARSLTVKSVISIDSVQLTDGSSVGNARWDLYIDSPRNFKGLARKQREKGDTEGRANQTSGPLVRYIRRGGAGHSDTGTAKTSRKSVELDTRRTGVATVARRVNVRFNYGAESDIGPGVQTTAGGNRRNDIAIGERQRIPRKLIHVKSESDRPAVIHASPKPARSVSGAPASFRQSGPRTKNPWASLKNGDADSNKVYHHPRWVSRGDGEILRRLSEDPIAGFYNFPAQHTCKLGLGFLVYEADHSPDDPDRVTSGINAIRRCSVQGVTCAVIFSPAEIHRVLAFHLDRVLGFHRTLPTVSRRLSGDLRRQVGLPVDVSFPLMLYEPSLYHDPEMSQISKSQLTACVSGHDGTLGLEWCNNVLTDDWSAVALFDFLLQIYHRMDVGCCGIDRSERLHRCSNSGGKRSASCVNYTTASSLQKIGCSYRLRSVSDQLVLVENLVDLRAPVDKLDVWLLQGLHSFPAKAVAMLRERRLAPVLLDSLSMDNAYWEDQGGLPAMEEILDIIDARGRRFLQYIDS